MLSPKQLYYYYTIEPCEFRLGTDPLPNDAGAGTPYNLIRLSQFLKQLKYPCYSKSPHVKEILDSGKNKLALPYKILFRIDTEAFSEIQPDIKSGTAMSVRNACDITRACDTYLFKTYDKWDHRTAYEYMSYFAYNEITDCLMMLGPDIVKEDEAIFRGTGCGMLDCLPKLTVKNVTQGSALGANHDCVKQLDTGSGVECTPCGVCDDDALEAVESNPDIKNCCNTSSCEDKMNFCCGDPEGKRESLWEYTNYSSQGFPSLQFDANGQSITQKPLIHGAILKRKSYGGYANLLNNTGKLYSCPGDILLRYIQKHNDFEYEERDNNQLSESSSSSAITKGPLLFDRMKTISLVYSSNKSEMMGWIKDLIYNGYGIVMMTNVGFSNKRDSTGMSFPDRIWYHSFSIIGYDDRKIEYDECVFLLSNTWGNWNSGGHPSWGPIPDGSFLVTETHLSCMLELYRSDRWGCREKTIPDADDDYPCTEDNSCVPWGCTKKQKALGFAFAMSLQDGFPKQNIDYTPYYDTK